jgi:hypothetical protein
MLRTALDRITASSVTIALKRAGLTKAEKNPVAHNGQRATMTFGFRTMQYAPTEVHVVHYENDVVKQAHELGRCEQALILAGYAVEMAAPRDRRMYLKVTRSS